MSLKRVLVAALAAVLPSPLARLALNAAGHKVSRGSRIGLSWIEVDDLVMEPGARIGHLNIIRIKALRMGDRALLAHQNRITGAFRVVMGQRALIGNRNLITRPPQDIYGDSALTIGQIAGVTSDHRLDLTTSISIGDFTTVAGCGSQIWTHGYIHEREGAGRYRIDGPVVIGSNVYIGSASFVSMGVTVADGVIVGGGTSVAKDLLEEGLYVSAPIRRLERPVDPAGRGDLVRLDDGTVGEKVYFKRTRG